MLALASCLTLTHAVGYHKIGTDIRELGDTVGTLTARAAAELGLSERVTVAVGIIDAHAGAIGTLGMDVGAESVAASAAEWRRRVSIISGTSACHLAVSQEPLFIRTSSFRPHSTSSARKLPNGYLLKAGVWGPYKDALVPGLWLNEGGESAVGSLVEYIVTTYAARAQLARSPP